MLDENRFIEEVWKKYEIESRARKKDEFYEKKQYKTSNNKLLLKTVASFLLVITITATAIGGTYAVVQNYIEEKIEQEKTDRTYDENVNYMYDRDENMTFVEDDRIYYGLIETYEEYLKYKENKIWNNMPKMAEEDFNSYFIVVVAGENTDRVGLYISDINVTEDTLEIGVKRNYEENTVVFTKLEKDKYRKNVEVKLVYEEPIMEGYMKLDDIPKDYTINQAIEDGCVVVVDNKFKTDDNQLKDFMKRTKNGENLCIRVAVFSDEDLIIVDIEYKNNKYIGCSYNLRYYWEKDFEGSKYYIVGDVINIDETRFEENTEMSNDVYVIENNKNGDDLEICRILIN